MNIRQILSEIDYSTTRRHQIGMSARVYALPYRERVSLYPYLQALKTARPDTYAKLASLRVVHEHERHTADDDRWLDACAANGLLQVLLLYGAQVIATGNAAEHWKASGYVYDYHAIGDAVTLAVNQSSYGSADRFGHAYETGLAHIDQVLADLDAMLPDVPPPAEHPLIRDVELCVHFWRRKAHMTEPMRYAERRHNETEYMRALQDCYLYEELVEHYKARALVQVSGHPKLERWCHAHAQLMCGRNGSPETIRTSRSRGRKLLVAAGLLGDDDARSQDSEDARRLAELTAVM